MQYAHKLVDLVGQHIHRMPSEQVRIYFCAAIIYCSHIKTVSLSFHRWPTSFIISKKIPVPSKEYVQSFELKKRIRKFLKYLITKLLNTRTRIINLMYT